MHVAFETTIYLKGSHVLLRGSHIFVVLILSLEFQIPSKAYKFWDNWISNKKYKREWEDHRWRTRFVLSWKRVCKDYLNVSVSGQCFFLPISCWSYNLIKHWRLSLGRKDFILKPYQNLRLECLRNCLHLGKTLLSWITL